MPSLSDIWGLLNGQGWYRLDRGMVAVNAKSGWRTWPALTPTEQTKPYQNTKN
ncbi:hypothetical protein ACFLY4_01395 [Chloroflexota bacterium]